MTDVDPVSSPAVADEALPRDRSSERDPFGGLLVSQGFQVLSFSAMFAYGATWLYFSIAYSRVGLQPEAAGIGVDFLLVRAATLGGIVALLTAFALSSARVGGVVSRGRIGSTRGFGVFFVLAQVGVFAATIFLADRLLDGRIPTAFEVPIVGVLALAIVLLEGALLLRGFGFSADRPIGPCLSKRLNYRYLGGAWLMVLFLVGVGIALAGLATGDQLRSGQPIDTPFFEVPRVAAVPSNQATAAAMERQEIPTCALLLGVRDDNAVLWDIQKRRSVVAGTANVSISYNAPPCRGLGSADDGP